VLPAGGPASPAASRRMVRAGVCLGLFAALALWAYFWPQTGDGDAIMHFQNARDGLWEPAKLLGSWARVGAKLPLLIPAQLGLYPARLVSAVISVLAAWQTMRLADDLGMANATLAGPLLIFQPQVFVLAADTMTELPFALVLVIAIRYGQGLSGFIGHESDEIILLTTFGAVLLVAGVAQRLQVSSAIGAFLVGIAVSGPLAKQSHRLLAPLRDLFAATFFFFFGLEIDPASLPPVLAIAAILGVVTAATKVLTGHIAARRGGADRRAALCAGMALVARGEFSIVIAGLGAGLEPRLGPISAAFVLLLAIAGPILARLAK